MKLLTTMRSRHALLTALALCVLASSLHAQTPTWSEDIACIVYTHCAPCHREDGAGHFELTSYNDAYFWREEMSSATGSRFMPPWPPDPEYRSLAHERLLTQEEIDLIASWVDAGAPEGDPGNAPPPPTFSSAWVIDQPDLTAVMEDFVIPSSTADLYRCFVLPIDNPTDRFITDLEVVPGNSAMVHHVLVFQDTSGQAQVLDAEDIGPGYTSFGGIGVPGAKLIGIWVPGADPFQAPTGMGIKLMAGADIVIQLHYPATSSTVEVDSTRVNMLFSTAPFTRNLAIDPVLDHLLTITDGPLVLAPNEVRTFHAQYTTTFPSTITAIGPHSHLLGKQMKAWAELPGGEVVPLIDIPDWDFRWQNLYSFRNPIHLPTGTTLYGEATYDNTANNPSDPPNWVWLGEATTNEMMLFYFAWTIGFPSDANIVVDTASHTAHYLDCVPLMSVGIPSNPEVEAVVAWPVPARDVLVVEQATVGAELCLVAMNGQVVHREAAVGPTHAMDVSALEPGMYVLEVLARGRSPQRQKVMLE